MHGVDADQLGEIIAITRYPVKSLVGEDLAEAGVDARGLIGDRQWAVRDPDGKFGSGKSTRRFRRMPGLLDLVASHSHDLVPVVRFPDGRAVRGDDPAVHDALTAHVGRPVTLAREGEVSHFDEGPLHVVTTSSLARLGELVGGEVDARHVRANLVVDTRGAASFDEHEWVGRDLRLGAGVLARVRGPMTRCLMLDLPQVGLSADGRLLHAVTQFNAMHLGLVVDVRQPGTVRLGDPVTTA